MPFRLSRQFVQLTSPLSTHGIFRQTMVDVMRALSENRDALLRLMDVFVNEVCVRVCVCVCFSLSVDRVQTNRFARLESMEMISKTY